MTTSNNNNTECSEEYHGRALRSLGTLSVQGDAVVSKAPISLLGFVDPKTGLITDPGHELDGLSVAGKILVYPRGIGSTVGPYTLLNLAGNRKAPLAIVNRESDQGTVSACSVAQIPLAYALDCDPTEKIKSGDNVLVKLTDGNAHIIRERKK